jgi:microsomal epoxide hydrolase
MLGACAGSRQVPAAPSPTAPPADAPAPAARAPAPPHDRFFLSSDGVRLHMIEAGPANATTLVFVPGWDMPAWIFERQIAAFLPRYHVVAFDPRGQGDSDIPATGYEPHRRGQDIADLLQALGPGKVVLAGWSLGVLDVLAYIADHGDGPVAALVLIDNSVGESPAPPPPAPPPRQAGHRRKRRPVRRPESMREFVQSMFRSPVPASYIDRLTESALRVPAADSARLLNYPVPRSFWRQALYSTGVPVLYVVRPHLAAQAHNLAAHRPHSDCVVLTGPGHALFVDDADGFDRLLAAFLARHDL